MMFGILRSYVLKVVKEFESILVEMCQKACKNI
jgi:hypothetical protein